MTLRRILVLSLAALLVPLVSAGASHAKVPKGAKYVGKTEQGHRITIKTARRGRKIRVFATTAVSSLCTQGGYPSDPQSLSILPPVPFKVKRSGRFSIDAPNESEDYRPNYRIKGKVTSKRVRGFFAYRRYKPFSSELCVTKEIKFKAKRKRG